MIEIINAVSVSLVSISLTWGLIFLSFLIYYMAKEGGKVLEITSVTSLGVVWFFLVYTILHVYSVSVHKWIDVYHYYMGG